MKNMLMNFVAGVLAVAALLVAIDIGWRELRLLIDRTDAACAARTHESFVDESRAWIVSNWTKSRRPFDPTALPDDIRPADIEYWGGNREDYYNAYVFYTPASGGVAFFVPYHRLCDFGVTSQPCPNKTCEFGRRRLP